MRGALEARVRGEKHSLTTRLWRKACIATSTPRLFCAALANCSSAVAVSASSGTPLGEADSATAHSRSSRQPSKSALAVEAPEAASEAPEAASEAPEAASEAPEAPEPASCIAPTSPPWAVPALLGCVVRARLAVAAAAAACRQSLNEALEGTMPACAWKDSRMASDRHAAVSTAAAPELAGASEPRICAPCACRPQALGIESAPSSSGGCRSGSHLRGCSGWRLRRDAAGALRQRWSFCAGPAPLLRGNRVSAQRWALEGLLWAEGSPALARGHASAEAMSLLAQCGVRSSCGGGGAAQRSSAVYSWRTSTCGERAEAALASGARGGLRNAGRAKMGVSERAVA